MVVHDVIRHITNDHVTQPIRSQTPVKTPLQNQKARSNFFTARYNIKIVMRVSVISQKCYKGFSDYS